MCHVGRLGPGLSLMSRSEPGDLTSGCICLTASQCVCVKAAGSVLLGGNCNMACLQESVCAALKLACV